MKNGNKMKCEVVNLQASKTGEIELNPNVFGLETRVDILARVIDWQLAKRRSGNHKTKGVSEITGTGKKMYRQKGTGGARHGSKRQAQFRGGAVIFGPVVRSHEYSLPKKIRKLGLKIALSNKLQAGQMMIVDKLELAMPKTKELVKVIDKLNLKNALMIDATVDANNSVVKAAGNIRIIDVLPQIGANVYDIMRKEKLVITVDAIKALEDRLQ